jgi:hypothetical protein
MAFARQILFFDQNSLCGLPFASVPGYRITLQETSPTTPLVESPPNNNGQP